MLCTEQGEHNSKSRVLVEEEVHKHNQTLVRKLPEDTQALSERGEYCDVGV